MARDNGGMKSKQRPAETASEQSFRDALAAALEVRAVSPAELARRIGRSGSAVSQWLGKADMPDLTIVIKIEDALDLRFGALVQHHSPDTWSIIAMKIGYQWPALSWKQKIEDGLIEAPYTSRQRKIVRDILLSYEELNLLGREDVDR